MDESANRDPRYFRFSHANTDDEIRECFPIMRELRPHLTEPDEFVRQVRRQMEQGYRLLAVWSGSRVVACAGYRLMDNLLRGRFLYVDDLATTASERSQQHGERLLRTLTEEAETQGCTAVVLDCGVANSGAHRFYFRAEMKITAFRFALDIIPRG